MQQAEREAGAGAVAGEHDVGDGDCLVHGAGRRGDEGEVAVEDVEEGGGKRVVGGETLADEEDAAFGEFGEAGEGFVVLGWAVEAV